MNSSKHSSTYDERVEIGSQLAAELVNEKLKYMNALERMDKNIEDGQWVIKYVISKSFLNQWKRFTDFDEKNIKLRPQHGTTPKMMNSDILKSRHSFFDATLEDGLDQSSYCLMSQEVARVFKKYHGNPIPRRVMHSGKKVIFDKFHEIKFFFMNRAWVQTAFKNRDSKIVQHTCLAFDNQTVAEFLSRMVSYSALDPSNRTTGNEAAKLWMCPLTFSTDNYLRSVKNRMENEESAISLLLPAFEIQIEQAKLIKELSTSGFQFVIEIESPEKRWIYQKNSINSIQKISQPPKKEHKNPLVNQPGSQRTKPYSDDHQNSQPQNATMKTNNNQLESNNGQYNVDLRQCSHCRNNAAHMAMSCDSCNRRYYCSAACKGEDRQHRDACGPNNLNSNPANKNGYNDKWRNENNHKWKNDYQDRSKTNNDYNYKNRNQNTEKQQNLVMSSLSKRGLVGLRNIGNTCYMNSALQCLSHTIELTNYFLQENHLKEINVENPIGTQGKLVKQFARFIKYMWAGTRDSYKPVDIKQCIGSVQKMFEGYQQHDSLELLYFLLDTIHEDLNRIFTKPNTEPIASKGRQDEVIARQSWFNHLKRNRSIIYDLFGGQFKSRVTCPQCNLHSLTFDPYLTIPLPIPEQGQQQIVLYFFYHDYRKDTQRLSITCRTNSLDELLAAIEKITEVPQNRIKLIVSGFNGIIREVMPEDTIKRLIGQKSLSLDAQERQIFAIEHSQKDLDKLDKKQFLAFKFLDSDKNAIHFKRIFPFLVDQKLRGKDLYDRICSFLTKHWIPETTYEKLRQQTSKGQSLQIQVRFGEMRLKDGVMQFEHKQKLEEKSKVAQIIEKYGKQVEFHVKIKHTRKMNLNQYKRHEDRNMHAGFRAKSQFTIDQCLQHFALTEILEQGNEWYCPRCKDLVIAEKQMEIYNAPRNLIFQLKRFKQKGYSKVKNEANITYPLQLDMKPYTLNHKLPETYFLVKEGKPKVQNEMEKNRKIIDSDGCKYELYAVVNHYGSLQGGHYTASAKNAEKWYKFNDDHISPMSQREVITSAAYLLFYRLMKN